MHFENREYAITYCLKIEKVTSIIVKHLFGLWVQKETKSLDNKGSALSLMAKANILYDCERISKEDYKKISHVMSIRNQFAHNYECDDFKDLPEFITGIEKVLIKSATTDSEDLEIKLKDGFTNVGDVDIVREVDTKLLELSSSQKS